MAAGGEVVGLQDACFAGCLLREILGPRGRAVPCIYEGSVQGRGRDTAAGDDDDVYLTEKLAVDTGAVDIWNKANYHIKFSPNG